MNKSNVRQAVVDSVWISVEDTIRHSVEDSVEHSAREYFQTNSNIIKQ